MRLFRDFLLTEQKNLHLEHLEDEVLNGGINGTRSAINFLQSLRDMLAGSSKSRVDVSVKWDGAPAIFVGINPENGKFFVGSKSVFAKNAKLNYSVGDISTNHAGGLADKLKVAFEVLSPLRWNGIFQGDMMFTNNDLKKETIEDKPYVTFQPNTILYAVPYKSADSFLSAKMGVVWHTSYSGKTMEDMTAKFGVKLSQIPKTKEAWMMDATYRDVSGTATFNKKDTITITKILSNAGKMFQSLKPAVLSRIVEDEPIRTLIKTFNNTKVKSGEKIKNTRQHTRGVIAFAYDKLKKDVDKVKREQTKKAKQQVMDEKMQFFRSNSSQLVKIFDMQNLLVDAKEMIIRKLEGAKGLTQTFIKTNRGFKVTAPEGFVAVDRLAGTAVKLVDRMEFSMHNFTAAKEWDK